MDAEAGGGREHQGSRWPKLGLLLLTGFVLFNVGGTVMFAFFERTTSAYRIPSSAMEPTLRCARPAPGCEGDTSDRVLVPRLHLFWTPGRGDIVVFETPPEAEVKCGGGGTFVKRIIGLPGDRVQIRPINDAGYVYINGRKLDEPYVQRSRRDIGPSKTFKVPPGSYFMMGDNRTQSCDSRQWGSVPRHNLVGPVVARYWPLDRLGSP